MTPLQAECLAYIQFLLAGELYDLGTLYNSSGVMAHIQIESNWEPEVGDHVDSFGSAGLMQVLPSTATQMGVHGSMLDPASSIRAGMLYLDNCRKILGHYRTKAGGVLTAQDVVAAYNEGPGNVMRGRQDMHYVDAWEAAQRQWAYVDALPMDPKAVEALFNWNQSKNTPPAETHQDAPVPEPAPEAGQTTTPAPAEVDLGAVQPIPDITMTVDLPSQVEPEPAPQQPAEADAALNTQGPGSDDQPEESDSADVLNEEELARLNTPPGQGPAQVTHDEGTDNPSLNGA